VAVALAVAFAASTGTQAHADTTPNPPPPRPLHDAASGSGALLGNYLAGRHAYATRDMWAAADYLSRALVDDPDNQTLLSRTVSLLVAVGRVDDALYLAQRLIESDPESRVAHILLALSAARAGDFKNAEDELEQVGREGLYAFLVPMLDSWVAFGVGGKDAALKALKPLSRRQAYEPFNAYQSALINDLAGDVEGAGSEYQRAAEAWSGGSVRVVAAYGAFLERTDRTQEARELYVDYRDRNPGAVWPAEVLIRFDKGHRAASVVTSPVDGLAEALFGAASAVPQQNTGDASLLFARLALYMRPNFPAAQILIGEILESLDRPADAYKAYSAVDLASPFSWTARLRATSNLASLEKIDDAVAALRIMTDERTDRSDAAISLGDTLRMEERYLEAAKAYDIAIQRTAHIEPRHWSLFYARGVALERSKNWDQAEADFLHALELQPEHPLVLNYLGYSWVEKGLNLDRARAMIEQAVSLRPSDGYIVDSLGWVLFRLGEFEGAVKQLERAVELMSNDPVINDHLGDAYWRVGRRNEATFQWKRALILEPAEDEVALIRRKLIKGLTAEAEAQDIE